MAMCYKKLWKLLIDRDMTRADLRDKTGLSPATLAKMSKGEAIGANILERICETMQCNVGDVNLSVHIFEMLNELFNISLSVDILLMIVDFI